MIIRTAAQLRQFKTLDLQILLAGFDEAIAEKAAGKGRIPLPKLHDQRKLIAQELAKRKQ